MTRPADISDRRYIPLFWRLFVPNATVLAAASVVLMVEPANGRIFALIGGLVTMLLVNVVLMRRAFAPLVRLTNLMARVDPLRPGRRLDVPGPASEVTVLADTFNAMLDRLERERRESGRRALAAQEAERRHLAAELHDQIGQTITAMVLQLDRLVAECADGSAARAAGVRDMAVDVIDDIRALARHLRPEALDELGLASALTNLTERLAEHSDLPIRRSIDRDLPTMTPEAELVIYRVAQESLTNVLRHADAQAAEVTLERHGDGVRLTVTDDGRGFDPDAVDQGGIRYMRERALLVGGTLEILPGPAGSGTTLRLDVGGEEAQDR